MSRTGATVLVVDDDAAVVEFCRWALSQEGHTVLTAHCAKEALAALDHREVDIVLSDVRMPDTDGMELLRSVPRGDTGPDVVLMTGYASIPAAVEALRLGAYDYIVKPFANDQPMATIRRLAELRLLRTENLVLRFRLSTASGGTAMVGESPAMQGVFSAIARVAPSRQPVLISGETGTGKELVARAIHDHGPESSQPFAAVDCGALSAGMIESELFGHLRGAFTGAIRDRPGLLASAGRGTLLLDEVGELPPDLQARFFRVLQEHEFRPVGADTVRRFEGRVIAATSKDLEAEVKKGSFRPELFFRLSVHQIHVPPLRARKGDIPGLARHFIQKHGGEKVLAISPEAMKQLADHHWPGNVRELESCIIGMIANCEGRVLDSRDFPQAFRAQLQTAHAASRTPLEEAERAAIVEALEAAGGNISQAALRLGIAKATLYRKLNAYGLPKRSPRG